MVARFTSAHKFLLFMFLAALLAGCSTTSTTTTTATATSVPAATPTAAPTMSTTSTTSISAINLKQIPLGDGKITTSLKVGYIDSCVIAFNPNRGGAFKDGPWIDTSNQTWDAITKIAVQGSVNWPQA